MGHGMDARLPEVSAAADPEGCLEAEFARCLVCQAGLVMAGEKPAAVFRFHPRSVRAPRATLDELVGVYARHLADEGVHLAPLAGRAESRMLLAWRPELIEALLADAGNRAFLRARALPGSGAAQLVDALLRRLRAYYAGAGTFPHEIGLVLGYPLEDGEGFIADGGRGARACGRWKVYGDPRVARERFERLGRVERHIRWLYAEGVPIRELLRTRVA